MLKKIWDKYNNLDVKLKASFWFMFCNMLQKGIALMTTPIFTRILTSEQYGTYSNYQSWYSIISIIATLNLYGGVYNNGLLKYGDKQNSFTSAIQGLSTTFTLFVFAIYIVFCGRWNDIFQLTTPLMVLMFVELIFNPAYSFWLIRNRFDYKYKAITIATVVSSVINPILAIFAIWNTSYKVEARVLSHTIVVVAFAIYFYVYHFIKGKKFYDYRIWNYALKFNIPLIPHYLSQIILQQSDRIMITRLVGAKETAFYSVAYSISMLMYIFTNAINSSLIPYTYQSIKNCAQDKLRNNIHKIVLLVACGCILAVLVTPEIIRIFATEEYYDAIWVMPPVCISVFFMFVYGIYSNVEFYYEKTKGIMVASILAATLNVILNYCLIPIYGYYAAGYTTLASYIIFALMHFSMYKNILKKKNIVKSYYNDKFIFIISAVSVICMVLLSFTYTYTKLRYTIVAIIVITAIINRKKIILLLSTKKNS